MGPSVKSLFLLVPLLASCSMRNKNIAALRDAKECYEHISNHALNSISDKEKVDFVKFQDRIESFAYFHNVLNPLSESFFFVFMFFVS